MAEKPEAKKAEKEQPKESPDRKARRRKPDDKSEKGQVSFSPAVPATVEELIGRTGSRGGALKSASMSPVWRSPPWARIRAAPPPTVISTDLGSRSPRRERYRSISSRVIP